jgi:catechol 2,3-dioxygenase-like lactoylglutathione lyase family enzyme
MADCGEMGRIFASIPILPSRDLNRSARFYAALGFKVEKRYPDYLILICAGVELHLSETEFEPGTSTAGLYIRVRGIDEWAQAFGKVAEDKPWGQREFAISDPDENLLRFGEPTAKPGATGPSA